LETRSEFQAEGLKTARERLVNLEAHLTTERTSLTKWENQKVAFQEEITTSEEAIASLREELTEIQEALDEKTKVVEQVKKTTSKASKVLDVALKEIATCVSYCIRAARKKINLLLQNDEIEKLALERSSVYRKCRLEEIKLPLLEGNLKNVPMEEVCIFIPGIP
jgi:structural maintenance of chromosome 1